MPLYSYVALTSEGEVRKGRCFSLSVDSLSRELTAQGLFLFKTRHGLFPTLFSPRSLLGRGRVTPEQFSLFNLEFIALLRAGLPITEALMAVSSRPDSPAFSHILHQVLDDIRTGCQPSEACARLPETFEPVFLSALRIGERSGDLVTPLARYQEYLKNKIELQKRVSQALSYPLFLLLTLGATLAVLLTVVMPRFAEIYSEFDAELPWPTRVLMTVTEHLPWIALGTLISVVLASVIARHFLGTTSGRLAWHRLKERLPLLGRFHRSLMVSQFARTLATLMGAGTPLLEALSAARVSLPNQAYALRVGRASQRVSEGQSLTAALAEENLVPSTALKLIEAGEASGSLADMLEEVARFHDERARHDMTRLIVLVEPLMMLLMGLMVGGVILIMYLPIFFLAEVIQ